MSHLLSLPGFSATGVAVQGGPGTLNPAGPAGFGPSWRMVVELGPEVRAWGTYPGGQSGNPVSRRYLDRLGFWRDGLLDTLFMPRDTATLSGVQVRARLRLVPGGAAP
jgi:penicillin G amidase